ncbi:hypothetical protein H4R33_006587 [Dimargaris cristalligena]|uniref:Uncharacterized protein n=1 Tax=Dimargaris cristalligena TaxID=215637 RepID=A0A4V1J5V3_9FUNG|nr:hypothetical protein H4R33_006587 [Dimargaris cristalligena]RKP40359.1 hypothetical protein BJ085DRAFT_37652 [Dimargaris cristalligena]|eukprot:RKP40359.1 hypothetical protein BJ085DRAFT_37652 [Dimargaris cristalligena]
MIQPIRASCIIALLAISYWNMSEIAANEKCRDHTSPGPSYIPRMRSPDSNYRAPVAQNTTTGRYQSNDRNRGKKYQSNSQSTVPTTSAVPPPSATTVAPLPPVVSQTTNAPIAPTVDPTAAISETTDSPAVPTTSSATGAPTADSTTVTPPVPTTTTTSEVTSESTSEPPVTQTTSSAEPTTSSPAGVSKFIGEYASAFSEFYSTSTDMVNIDICEWGQQPRTQSVTRPFAENMAQLGSGRWNGNQWFTIVEGASTARPFGCFAPTASAIGQLGSTLYPYSSVAALDYQIGDTLYVKDLDGLALGPTQKHNGCLIVEGRATPAGSVAIYILSQSNFVYFEAFNKNANHDVEKKACDPIQTYQTSSDPATHL